MTSEARTAEAGTAEAGTAEAGTAEAGTAEAGTAEAGTAEAGTAEAGTAEAGTADGGDRRRRGTGRLTVLSGPSGVGKGSVIAAVRRRHPSVWLSVSATTRPPRPGEVDGVHYHFVDTERFDQMVAAGDLLEHATYAGHSYGTPRRPVEERLAAGRPALLEIELQGARQVRSAMPDAQLVFLAPPSFEELARRLSGRGTEDPERMRRRLDLARIELAAEDEFDVVVVNDDLEAAADRLVALTGLET